jgi:hypothetical protein
MQKRILVLLLGCLLGLLSCAGKQKQATNNSAANNAAPPNGTTVPLATITDPVAFASQLKQSRNPHIIATARELYQRRMGTEASGNNAIVPFFGTAANPNSDFTSQAYPLMAALWVNPNIGVCWENPTAAFGQQMQNVQKAVSGTWESASRLRFTGWQKCPQVSAKGEQVIRIFIDDSSSQNGPHTLGLGNQLAGEPNGMLLNFTFLHWGTNCQTMVDYCIKAIAVHEFGHAIGFAHEQNRPDTPGECMEAPQGSNGDTLLTPYDPDSVMNYCNKKYNNNGELSALDKEAVLKLYGAPLYRRPN